MYCYHEFKLRYLKNLKLFSVRVKELFEPRPIVLWKKKRRRVFALFKSIFLRNRSLCNAGWFYGKKRKIGKGNLYLTENRLSENEMCCASDNHNYMCHTCAKELLDLWIKQLLTKYQIFTKLAQIPHIHINRIFSSIFGINFLDQLLHPYKYNGRDMSGILFIFASCEPINQTVASNKEYYRTNSIETSWGSTYTQEDALTVRWKWVFRACDITNGRLMLYWVGLYVRGCVNRPLVLTHARKTHFQLTVNASSYVYV